MIRWQTAAVCAAIAVSVTGCGDDEKTPDESADRAAIEQALVQWPNDFNDRNVDAVCSLFAPDTQVVYPDSQDRDYEAFCAQMHDVLGPSDKTFRYAAPDIETIIVDGDLATVSLIWTLTVTDSSGVVLETVEENGVDVFQRQDDGSWKIRISHAFPL
ncbi:DUF4440 domain-containing protein [Antrihabitans sp. YC2-6]|uniref:YybH family protein n=1 Tax=Antrihabitans sp. YC2-6 TaxID=2799498 RepID=UPI0018F4A61F|nr:nuclear transport factor 2 family protein [Antrihabitans sp. YC2-6]MBJ8348168.1 nuclear transport factor 2 family protein [Antrihabitans sp. YC2-6]